VSALLGSPIPAIVERDFLPYNTWNPNHRYINADSSLSSSDESSSDEEVTQPETETNEIIDLDEFVPVSVSSISSSESEQSVEVVDRNFAPNIRVDSRIQAAQRTNGGPIVIHDCPECNFFAFNKPDLDTHIYAVHEFPKKNVGIERKEENKFRIQPKFKRQVGYQVLKPRNMKWTNESVKNNRYPIR
jgi:hypothetical protein